MFTNYQLDLGTQQQTSFTPGCALKQLTKRLVYSYPTHEPVEPVAPAAPASTEAPRYTCVQLKEAAEVAYARGEYGYAEQLWFEILREFNTALPPRAVAHVFECLAMSLQHQKKYARAELFFRSSANIKRRLYGMYNVETAAALENLAALYNQQRRYSDAQYVLEQVLCIYERTIGSRTAAVADTAAALARLFVAQDMLAQAEPMYQKALMVRTNSGVSSPETDSLLEDYRHFLELCGKSGKSSRSNLRIMQSKVDRPKLPSVRRLDAGQRRLNSTQKLPKVVGI